LGKILSSTEPIRQHLLPCGNKKAESMPVTYVKPYVKRQKNDGADAEDICEAVTRSSVRFVATKTSERYFNNLTSEWTTLWCQPKSAIQVIAGDAIKRFAEIEHTHPHESLIGREFELQLPFDRIQKRFIGNRYGEYLPFIPGNTEYVVNARSDQPGDYYWWLKEPCSYNPTTGIASGGTTPSIPAFENLLDAPSPWARSHP
jgi:hypothetical protein